MDTRILALRPVSATPPSRRRAPCHLPLRRGGIAERRYFLLAAAVPCGAAFSAAAVLFGDAKFHPGRVFPPWALLLRRSRGRSRTVTHSGEGFQDIGHSPPANGKRPCRNGQTGRGVSIGEMELEKGIIMLLGGEIARQSAGGAVRVRSRKFPLAI